MTEESKMRLWIERDQLLRTLDLLKQQARLLERAYDYIKTKEIKSVYKRFGNWLFEIDIEEAKEEIKRNLELMNIQIEGIRKRILEIEKKLKE